MKVKSLFITLVALAGVLLAIPGGASAALSWSAGSISGTPNGPIVAVAWNESQNPGGQLFVAITKPTSSLGTNDLLTSTDGQSWTVRSSGVAGAWNDIVFGGLNNNREFWVVGDSDKIMYGNSTGTTWGEVAVAGSPSDSTQRAACSSACGNWTTGSVGDSDAIVLYSSNGFVIRSNNGTQGFSAFSQSSTVGTVNYSAAAYYQVPNSSPIEWRVWSFGTGSTPAANSTTALVYHYTSPSAPTVTDQRGISAPFTGANGPVLAATSSYTLANSGPSRTEGMVIAASSGVYRSNGDPNANWSLSSLSGLTAANVRGIAESNNKWLVVDNAGNTWVATGIGGSWSTAPPISGATPEDAAGSWKLCKFVVVGGSAIHYSSDDSNTCSGGGGGGGGGGASNTNLVAPALTLSGCTLTVSRGLWSGPVTVYSYSWVKFDGAASGGPTRVAGTTSSTTSYTATTGDVGKYFSVGEVVNGVGGTGSATTARVGPIGADCGSGSTATTAATSATTGKPAPGPALKVADIPAEITLDLGSSMSSDGTIPPDQPITAEVPCSAPEGQLLDRCTVNVTAPEYVLLGQGDGINVRSDKKISIGKATVKAKSGKKVIVVKVKINGKGRKALQRNLKITATVGLTAITVSNLKSTGEANTTMRLPTQLISPEAGIFDSNSVSLNKAGVAFVNRLAALLPKTPKQMVFIGFADNTGVPGDNRWLGDRRAKAVRDALEAKGVTAAKSSIETKAARSPRADNSKAAGRERNRRVSIRITY